MHLDSFLQINGQMNGQMNEEINESMNGGFWNGGF